MTFAEDNCALQRKIPELLQNQLHSGIVLLSTQVPAVSLEFALILNENILSKHQYHNIVISFC